MYSLWIHPSTVQGRDTGGQESNIEKVIEMKAHELRAKLGWLQGNVLPRIKVANINEHSIDGI